MTMITVKKSSTDPSGFSVQVSKDIKVIEVFVNPDTTFLNVIVNTGNAKNQHYYFDKQGDSISWKQREIELKNKDIEIKYHSNEFKTKRQQRINMETGGEFFEDTLFYHDFKIDQSQCVVYSPFIEFPITKLYDKHIEEKQRKIKRDNNYRKMTEDEKISYWLSYVAQVLRNTDKINIASMEKDDPDIGLILDKIIENYGAFLKDSGSMEKTDIESIKKKYFIYEKAVLKH